jgi:RNA polymerase sigma-B factor
VRGDAASGGMRADDARWSDVRRRRNDARLQRRQLGGDGRARTELVEQYLPLARSLAWRSRTSGEPIDDLVQVASLGLVKALQRWDPERGTTFATFAVPTMLGELRHYLRDRTWAVKPPRAEQELALAVRRAHAGLSQQRSHAATVAEIATTLQRTEEEVLDALEAGAAQRAESLNVPVVDGDEGRSFLDLHGEPDAGYARVMDASMLDDLTACLDMRSREVLRLHFHEDLLQREIAERIGCSQMQVSRIVRDALSRLRLHAGLTRQPGIAPA